MRSFWTIFVLILFSGCGSFQKFCCKQCQVETKDSIYSYDTYSCDSFPVFIPYHEIKYDTTFNFDQPVVYHKVVYSNGLTSIVDLKHGKLTVLCAEDSLRKEIEFMRKTSHEKELKAITKEVPDGIKNETNIDIACKYIVGIELIFILIWLIFKAVKMYLKG